jgi:hypothetical protein
MGGPSLCRFLHKVCEVEGRTDDEKLAAFLVLVLAVVSLLWVPKANSATSDEAEIASC